MGKLLNIQQWVEMNMAASLRDVTNAKRRYKMYEMALMALENGSEVSEVIKRAYWNWHEEAHDER